MDRKLALAEILNDANTLQAKVKVFLREHPSYEDQFIRVRLGEVITTIEYSQKSHARDERSESNARDTERSRAENAVKPNRVTIFNLMEKR